MKKNYTFVLAALILTGCATTQFEENKGIGGKEAQSLYKLQQTLSAPKAKVELRKAERNPKMSKDEIGKITHQFLEGSRIDSIDVSESDIKWASEKLNHVDNSFTLDSSVWAVTVVGDLNPPFPWYKLDKNGEKKKMRAKSITFALSVEDGDVLAATAVPMD